ncbi:MAG: TrmH family RNA methyltransferase [Nonlabens sp.]|jgi:TrmH family RNA methyltransferase
MSYKNISSVQNPTVKRLLLLQSKAKARRLEDGFLVEGLRELKICISGGYTVKEIYFVPDFVSLETLKGLFTSKEVPECIAITEEVYKKLAYRESTEGVIAFAKAKTTTLSNLQLTENSLILIAEAPEKPGNIGALLRTADAANLDAVIIANPRTDLYNPNIIRSSVGCVFTNQIASAPTAEVIAFLKQKNIAIYSAILQEAQNYHEQDYTGATALVVGTEATGLTEAWREASTQNVKIPMQGAIDSMNVSVAAGILVFEAKRQRGF